MVHAEPATSSRLTCKHFKMIKAAAKTETHTTTTIMTMATTGKYSPGSEESGVTGAVGGVNVELESCSRRERKHAVTSGLLQAKSDHLRIRSLESTLKH